jgi:hypothetical protein
MSQPINEPVSEDVLNGLAIELFRTFSRFEYALKAAGFHNGEGRATPNWRNFAVSIETWFENPHSPELREAIRYLRQHPPKKQIIQNGLLKWSTGNTNTDSRADEILLYVRQVRNNLFHGGKFNGNWFAPQRSEKLLRYSLIILQACLEASPQVAKAYHN